MQHLYVMIAVILPAHENIRFNLADVHQEEVGAQRLALQNTLNPIHH